MVLDKKRMEKIREAGRKITGFDYTGFCFRCKCQLETPKEIDQNYCETCWVQYCDEYDAMHSDDGRTKYKQSKKS